MANSRITMRKIKETLRLHFDAKLPNRSIGRSLNISKNTVSDYLARFKASGLSWPLREELDDVTLEGKLFPEVGYAKSSEDIPDCEHIHKELKRKAVTLSLLWTEYKQAHPEGYQYTQFCEHYRRYKKTLHLSMRQQHKAGEKLFIDYAGYTIPIKDPNGGASQTAQIFLAVWGASCYTYAEATWTQGVGDWLGSHIRAFEFFGGVPELLVPDNLKSAVIKASRYDPDLNPAYRDLATYYSTAVLPARVRKPKDKAKVENGVRIVERSILAVMRNRTFFTLEELNQAIRELLAILNQRPFKKLPGCRQGLFESLDKPVIKPLPSTRYQVCEWHKHKVPPEYHVEVERHYYSVPYHLVTQTVETRVSEHIVEVLFKGKRVASHKRSREIGGMTTLREHMPLPHQRYLDWTPEKIRAWAVAAGPETQRFFQTLHQERSHPAVADQTCLGIIRLEKEYPVERIEAACRHANLIGAERLDSIRSILKNGIDRFPPAPPESPTPIQHGNIRGASYYAGKEVFALPRIAT